MPIKTNHLKYEIDYNRLSEKYDFFDVKTSKEYIKNGSYILDVPAVCNGVCSVLFTRGKHFFVMMDSAADNRTVLHNALTSCEDGSSISFSPVKASDIEDGMLLQLLLNGIGNSTNSILKFNNLTGHLYCFHPEWIKRGKKGGEDVIWKVPSVEIRITKDCNLLLNVRTFTSELLKKQISFGKRKYTEYPKYTFFGKTIKRKLKEDDSPAFILRQTDGAKTEIPFLDIQNIEKFSQSKMGVLAEIVNKFNERYNDMCRIWFDEIEDFQSVEHSKRDDRISNQAINAYLHANTIKIVDKISDQYSQEFCKQIQALLEKKYGVNANIGKRVDKAALNIVLIHNVSYYIDAPDPHNEDNGGAVVQHITFEDFSDSSEFALDTVIHELLIKEDLKNNRISLFDWSSLGIDEISFGTADEIDDVTRYFFMKIQKDGTFDITEQEFDLFSMDEYSQCVQIYEDAKTAGENVKGIIRDLDGNINIIKDTDWFTIPEIFDIKSELAAGNTKLRGREKRQELLSAVLDIKALDENGEKRYFVNDIGEGMRCTVRHASNIRKIEKVGQATDLFSQLLPLMDVTFVRNGQLTVIPFPFKYLREYISNLES